MDNLITKCFWGFNGEEFSEGVKTLLGAHGNRGAFAGDNLIAFGRNLSFLTDEKFMDSFQTYITPDNVTGWGTIWRLYMFAWSAKTCLKRPGDFVECGVSSGASSAIMCKYLDFQNSDRNLYLYDAWGTDSRIDSSAYGFSEETVSFVRDRFSQWPNVKVCPGFIPESFSNESPKEIAFLHIDLNNAAGEIAVLETLFDKVVHGGIVLFDDYGFTGFRASKKAEDEWLSARGYAIAELPTGQGLLIK